MRWINLPARLTKMQHTEYQRLAKSRRRGTSFFNLPIYFSLRFCFLRRIFFSFQQPFCLKKHTIVLFNIEGTYCTTLAAQYLKCIQTLKGERLNSKCHQKGDRLNRLKGDRLNKSLRFYRHSPNVLSPF